MIGLSPHVNERYGFSMIDVIPTLAFGFISDIEITITGLSENQLVFEYRDILDSGKYNFHMILFHPKDYQYKHFDAEIMISEYEKRSFDNVYKVSIKIKEIKEYIEILNAYRIVNKQRNSNHELQKLKSFDELFTKTYPFEKDKERFESYETQISSWFHENCCSTDFNQSFTYLIRGKELAFAITNKEDYRKLIDIGIQRLISDKINEFHLQGHPIANLNFSRVYIGSEFCPNLFPDMDVFERLLDKLLAENYDITICYPYLQENRLKQVKSILALLQNISTKCINIEITINDWGLLEYIQNNNFNIECILGRLLNKRKKDPRYPYWMGYNHNCQENKSNNLNNEIFRDYLYSIGIKRFEFEDYDQAMEIPKGKHSLHYPYYQINTSAFCNLYADVKKKSQDNVSDCELYCQHIYYEYPEHINLIGKGNTIFGYNKQSVLYDLEKLKYYIENNINRFVLTL